MIINREESEVTTLGEVQKFKVSIDENNLNHIVTILSSNLYSYPVTSFLRETVSNAVDSHIEAGVDEPIIITVTAKDLSIRDFGTGISPERFRDIYINIGSSTKRQSNDYIGSFGLGRFSCLSVSKIANITSFYNGRAYYYVMNKDIDQLHIDLLFERDTDEPNGVEVKIPYTEALTQDNLRSLYFIKNVYIENERECKPGDRIEERLSDIIKDFNKRKTEEFKNFKVLDLTLSEAFNKPHILIGNIPYKVDYSQVIDHYYSYEWREALPSIFPKINIGEVDITPNREELLYSDRTKRVLQKAVTMCIEELRELWNNQTEKEFTNFIDFADEIRYHNTNILYLTLGGIVVSPSLPYKVKFKDFPSEKTQTLKSIIQALYASEMPLIAEIENATVHTGKTRLRNSVINFVRKQKNSNSIFLALPSAAGFSSPMFKAYLAQLYPEKNHVCIFRQIKCTMPVLRHWAANIIGYYLNTNKEHDSQDRHLVYKVIREFLLYINQKIKQVDLLRSQEYQQFRKNNNIKKKPKRRISNINCNVVFTRTCTTNHCSIQPDNIIGAIKKISGKNRVVYSQKDNVLVEELTKIHYPNLSIVVLNQRDYSLAQKGELFPKWIQPVETIYSPEDRHLRRYAAFYRWSPAPRESMGIDITVAGFLPVSKAKEIRYLKDLSYKYAHSYSDILKIVPPEKDDREITEMLKRNTELLKLLCFLEDRFQYSNRQLVTYLLLKQKKIRLNYTWYKTFYDTYSKPLKEI